MRPRSDRFRVNLGRSVGPAYALPPFSHNSTTGCDIYFTITRAANATGRIEDEIRPPACLKREYGHELDTHFNAKGD